MRNIRQWLMEKIPKSYQQLPLPIAERVKLTQSFYALDDQRFLSVSLATEERVEDILTIEKLCYDGQTPWNRAALLHEIRYNRNAFYIIVTDHGKPVAFIGSWFVASEAHITNIATIPSYEGKGIATFLISELKRIAESENMTILSLEVRVSNNRAQRLYEKIGFKKGIIKKGYYANDHEDALEMAMMLPEKVVPQHSQD
ncbi:ribosomal protein S18-alanine N-acetyltransferase [Marinilactibacillus piezotolerans]|uniref:ribosomal protein S18-alanine N-acetyltransferase n=1 Tax=Marinilactibacillus piezotolerans TaxID=258723 RepID=UPI002118B24A|nr:ribosomal protein S18-alanine N-acetyltransferase [Marinilactibacillus piezotolerans]